VLEYIGHSKKNSRVRLALVGAPCSSKVSFGKYANRGHDEERGECHDVKIGVLAM